ncbi:somatolactin beta [Xyrauchen texanus]|uniref:somatolactin beta n=1 Tax=Xyrauchen texanus TaxID=154827 RepID=UPI002241EFF0|nr:somatolactin beta [Xyrauchen texanus]
MSAPQLQAVCQPVLYLTALQKKSVVLQVCMGVCSLQAMIASALACPDNSSGGTSCTISVEKLLDRALQHAELLYRISDESKIMFEEMFFPDLVNQQVNGGPICASRMVLVPTSKSEIQQISEKWLLHSVLILAQFWIDPLVDLHASLERYDSAPSALLNKTKWLSTKLMSLEKGILVLIRQILAEGGLLLESPETSSVPFASTDMLESVRRDYSVLYCFRKDAHKMEIFLKFLKCRETEKQNCSFF